MTLHSSFLGCGENMPLSPLFVLDVNEQTLLMSPVTGAKSVWSLVGSPSTGLGLSPPQPSPFLGSYHTKFGFPGDGEWEFLGFINIWGIREFRL